MPAMKRKKTRYPGVVFLEALNPATGKPERVYYIRYRRNGKQVEEKAGRQGADAMTPARAASMRVKRMDGNELSNRARREAEEAARQAEEGRPILARLWREFEQGKSHLKSIRDDRYRWNKHLAQSFNDKEPRELVTLDLDRLRVNLKRKGLSPATQKQVLVLLKRIINYGVQKGLCAPPNPSRLHFEMPVVRNERTEDLSPDQLERLLNVLDAEPDVQIADLMRLALFTGMRRGELFRLRWEHLDFERGFITLVDTKGGGDQKIPMNDTARTLLESHPKTGSPYVFPGRGGRQRVDCRKQVDRIKRKAGLPKDFRPLHGLRHAFASMLASSGQVDSYTLQKLLTHKSPAMTQRYAHLRDEALKRAASVADGVFSQVGSQDKQKVVNLAERRK